MAKTIMNKNKKLESASITTVFPKFEKRKKKEMQELNLSIDMPYKEVKNISHRYVRG